MQPFEPPKYIASLIAAINDGGKAAQAGMLALAAIGVYVLAIAISITDEDCLVNHAVTVSQVGVAIPLVASVTLAPIVFVAAHVYTLLRCDMLAWNLRRLLADMPAFVPDADDRDRCRQLLANVEYIQAAVTPGAAPDASRLFRLASFALLVVLPLMTLLLIQLNTLRLQSEMVTWLHRTCLVADLACLIWFALRRWPPQAVQRTLSPAAIRFWSPLVVPALAIVTANLLWFGVPGVGDVTVGQPFGWTFAPATGDPTLQEWQRRRDKNLAFLASAIRQPLDLLFCPAFSLGCRFLSAEGRTLVANAPGSKAASALLVNFVSDANLVGFAVADGIDLRGRNLRFAKLSGSILVKANLRDAHLEGAYLEGADLRGVNAIGASFAGAHMGLTDDVRSFVRFDGAKLRDAIFSDAFMPGARMQGADLEGADFRRTYLPSADLRGVKLRSANFLSATMIGADLRGACLSPGAFLNLANLYGADLRGADMRGASLQFADLRKAKLGQAQLGPFFSDQRMKTNMRFADLREADLTTALDNAVADSDCPRGPNAAAATEPAIYGPVLVTTAPDPRLAASVTHAVADIAAFSEAAVRGALEVIKDSPGSAENFAALFTAVAQQRFNRCTDQRFAMQLLAMPGAERFTLSTTIQKRLEEARAVCSPIGG